MVVEDSKKIISTLNKEKFMANEFAYLLRVHLWNEIFGIDDDEEKLDILDPNVWNFLIEQAKVKFLS